MSEPVAKLSEVKPEPLSKDVVERLEHLLEKAKRGEISSFAAAIVYRDGNSGEVWSAIPHYSIMIGALERMKWNMLRQSEE